VYDHDVNHDLRIFGKQIYHTMCKWTFSDWWV